MYRTPAAGQSRSTPIMGAAEVLKLPELLSSIGQALVGHAAGVTTFRGRVLAAVLPQQPADAVWDLLPAIGFVLAVAFAR